MKTILVPVFPGTNCDQETLAWAQDNFLADACFLSLPDDAAIAASEVAAVLVPGGFTFGDYLRTGALAARSPEMAVVKRLANAGVPTLGICNGFQMLCEAGLLPGVLVKNASRLHHHYPVALKADVDELERAQALNRLTVWMPPLTPGSRSVIERLYAEFALPLSCGMGNYVKANRAPGSADPFAVLLRYAENELGSAEAIAGIASLDGRIAGMMPHPERASDAVLGGDLGLLFLYGLAMNTGLPVKPKSPLALFARKYFGAELPSHV